MQIAKVFLISFFFIGCSRATEAENQSSGSRQENSVRIENTIREIDDYLSAKRENQLNILIKNASEAVLKTLEDDDFDDEKSQVVFLFVSEDGYSPGRLVVYWVGETLLFEGLRVEVGDREYRLSIPDDYREYLAQREEGYFDGHAILTLESELHERLLEFQRSDKLASVKIDLIQKL